MGKRLNYKGKLNLLLITYSFFITFMVLVSGFLLIDKIDKPSNSSENYFIKYSEDEFNKDIINGSIAVKIEEIPTKVINIKELQENYNKKIISNAIIIMLVVFLVVMALSVLISKFISRKVIQPIEKLAMALPELVNGNIEGFEKDVFVSELSGIKSALMQSSEKIKKLLDEANSLNSYISHEQKNTLAVLRAKIQLGERDELIALVDKMSASLDDILALNATENLKEDEEVDLALVSAEAVDVYSKLYKNIELEIDEEEIPIVRGRELWIYRAVCNLIENAIKYGNNSKVIVKVYNQNGSSIILVQDSGNGINKDVIDKIFNYKYRGENLKKDGYGIGLSLVNQITKLCGGVAFVESKEGEGSKFYMAFKTLTLD